ncbi:MAG: RDD family protein, partial [Candidatus Hodarchaeales archaeon]
MKKVCVYCGAINDADAHFCEKCGSEFERISEQVSKTSNHSERKDEEPIRQVAEITEEFKVAPSDKRFWAWLIDAFISWGFLTTLVGLAGYYYGDPFLFSDIIFFYEESFIFGIGSLGLVSFVYFVILEYFTGTTIGKSAMNLAIISKSGNRPSFLAIVINSIGKSFAFVF